MWNAADSNCAEAIELCLRQGCPIDHTDDEGQTMLLRATKKAHANAVQFLIERKANVNFQPRHGQGDTPLIIR